MPRQFDPDEFAAAMRQVKHPKAPADTNTLPAEPLAVEEWQHSEEFKVRVIAARAKLKLMRDRSEALQDSLQEFRFRQSRMRAGSTAPRINRGIPGAGRSCCACPEPHGCPATTDSHWHGRDRAMRAGSPCPC